jgi:hypothetical protein
VGALQGDGYGLADDTGHGWELCRAMVMGWQTTQDTGWSTAGRWLWAGRRHRTQMGALQGDGYGLADDRGHGWELGRVVVIGWQRYGFRREESRLEIPSACVLSLRIYKTIISPVVLRGCETWSLKRGE